MPASGALAVPHGSIEGGTAARLGSLVHRNAAFAVAADIRGAVLDGSQI